MQLTSFKHITFVAFLFGFVWDSITLSRVDRLYDMAIIGSYLCVIAAGLILMYAPKMRMPRHLSRLEQWMPLLVQFAMGGLLGSSLVYYARSGTFLESWPFLVMVVTLILFNEFVHRKVASLTSQVALYYFILYIIVALYVPVIVGTMGFWTFALSGLIGMVLASLPVWVITFSSSSIFNNAWKRIVPIWILIFVILNGFYLLNVIPPIPLALKDIGIYHGVLRMADGNYEVEYEPKDSWIPLPWGNPESRIVHITPGQSLFAWSAVFAPKRFSAPIYHRWQRYNPDTEEWDTKSQIRFQIGGGRNEGYRGYTQKLSVTPGKWRVVVENERGSVIGQRTFSVVVAETPPTLVTETK